MCAFSRSPPFLLFSVLYLPHVHVGILQAADKALGVLKRIRAGMTAEKRKRGAVKMSSLFTSKKRKTAKRNCKTMTTPELFMDSCTVTCLSVCILS